MSSRLLHEYAHDNFVTNKYIVVGYLRPLVNFWKNKNKRESPAESTAVSSGKHVSAHKQLDLFFNIIFQVQSLVRDMFCNAQYIA